MTRPFDPNSFGGDFREDGEIDSIHFVANGNIYKLDLPKATLDRLNKYDRKTKLEKLKKAMESIT